jgi:hypothetical protein
MGKVCSTDVAKRNAYRVFEETPEGRKLLG